MNLMGHIQLMGTPVLRDPPAFVTPSEVFMVVVTTYGVGELSAINGIAGAFSECLPVIHIVGNTATHVVCPLMVLTKQNAHLMIHHCIGPEPDHGVYRGMSEPVRAASTFINDPAVAAEEIDVSPQGR
jgi:pyruvate decarboxylase